MVPTYQIVFQIPCIRHFVPYNRPLQRHLGNPTSNVSCPHCPLFTDASLSLLLISDIASGITSAAVCNIKVVPVLLPGKLWWRCWWASPKFRFPPVTLVSLTQNCAIWRSGWGRRSGSFVRRSESEACGLSLFAFSMMTYFADSTFIAFVDFHTFSVISGVAPTNRADCLHSQI